jgi:hypothetical protein
MRSIYYSCDETDPNKQTLVPYQETVVRGPHREERQVCGVYITTLRDYIAGVAKLSRHRIDVG